VSKLLLLSLINLVTVSESCFLSFLLLGHLEMAIDGSFFNALLGPFCQRVLLTLEEKNLPYDMKFVDLGNKPEW